MANGTKELNTSPITIEDEINEFSEKPVQGKTLYKKLKELEDGTLPDTTAASAGNALVLDEDKNPVWAAGGGGGGNGGIAIVNLISIESIDEGSKIVTTFDKTFNEIYELVVSKTPVFLYSDIMYDDGVQSMPPTMQLVMQVDPSDFSVFLSWDYIPSGSIDHSYIFDGLNSNTVTIVDK